jgi:hypothetical protein
VDPKLDDWVDGQPPKQPAGLPANGDVRPEVKRAIELHDFATKRNEALTLA